MKFLVQVFCGFLLGVAVLFSGCENNGNKYSPTVTLAEYNQLAYGMNYDQVVGILGRHENKVTSATGGPYAQTGTVYTWFNRDNSELLCTFVSTTLVLKAETNLQ